METNKKSQVVAVYPVVFSHEYAKSGVPGYWYTIPELKGKQLTAYKKAQGSNYAEQDKVALYHSKFKLPADSRVKQLDNGKIYYDDYRELELRGLIASEKDPDMKALFMDQYAALRMSGSVASQSTPQNGSDDEVTKTEDIGIDEG